MSVRRKVSTDYAVGYGKPPVHSRFRKGRSGNPRGRPRGTSLGRTAALALAEAYRPVTVREGNTVIQLPAIQAVLRAQVALAAKGNGPAQRALVELVQTIESGVAPAQPRPEPPEPPRPLTPIEAARVIAFALAKAKHEQDQSSGASSG